MLRIFTLIFIGILPLLLPAQGGLYSFYALKFGERKKYVPMHQLAIGDKSGDSTKVIFMYWVLKNKEKVILVDAGFTSNAGINSNVIRFTSPEKLLADIAVKPEEVTDIIITHPHWDHLGGIHLYPQAMVWLQEEDYEDLMAQQKNPEKSGFNIKDINEIRERKMKGTLTLLKGLRDQEILPGVTVYISKSQHTPGSQYVMATNGIQQVILASDNCKYYRNIHGLLPSPATSDKNAYLLNLISMKELIQGNLDFVIPGHDPLVFSKFKMVTRDVVEILRN